MSLIKNSAWNLAGFAIPILIAIPAIGYLARALGVEKFGIFTLAYAVVGYASIFDAGLSRAVIRAVAMNTSDEPKLIKILGTSTGAVIFLSIIAAFILFVSANRLPEMLSITAGAQADAATGFKILSVVIIPYLLSTVWFSYLEGESEFRKLNILKTLTGITISVFPVLGVLYEPSFTNAVIGLLLGRMFTAIIAYCYGLGRFRKSIFCLDIKTLKELLGFGGWITVSNIISPVMVYFDRFFISSVVGAQSVAFYTAPAEAIARLLVVPMAVAKVIFPKLSAQHDDAKSQTILAYKLLGVFSVLLAIFVYIFAKEIMFYWMGPSYVGDSVLVLQILVVGFVFNSIAQIPFAQVQAAGYSKITAFIHLAEVIPYLVLLYWLVHEYSYVGAAIAWSIRVGVDLIVLAYYAQKIHVIKHI